MTQYLAEDLGMYVDYGPGPNKHTWGAAMLSKFPIINSTHHLLPSPRGELAPAIHATLDVYGQMIDVIVSHNGTFTSQSLVLRYRPRRRSRGSILADDRVSSNYARITPSIRIFGICSD